MRTSPESTPSDVRPPQPAVHLDPYANLAIDLGVTMSVGRRGQCWDNAVAESFFATVKTELIHRRTWPTHEATSAHFDYIEGWCNTRRRHSTLGYLSPTQYESSITVTGKQVA